MIDPKLLRTNIEKVSEGLSKRGYQLDVETFEDLEKRRKVLQNKTQLLQNIRNKKSRDIGKLKSQEKSTIQLISDVSYLNNELRKLEKLLVTCQKEIKNFICEIPNIPCEKAPLGDDSNHNVEVSRWGIPKAFDFDIQDHVTLGKNLRGLDFQLASKIAGSRFVVMKNEIAIMHRALISFMMDTHVYEHGYQEVYIPYLANQDSLYGTGQLPKFSEEVFNIDGKLSYSLIPTAEVPITNFVRDEVIDIEKLPLKFVSHSPCFRREAGSYGKDTRGLIRQHQFEKVEMVQIVAPHTGAKALESLRQDAEAILRKLNLPYRVMELCAGDTGFSSKKTYDLEVWISSQRNYREVSSCSWCGDFQARRMQARFKSRDVKKPEYLHTLNGSGLAVGRTLLAILENNQQQDGSIIVPEALRKYMKGTCVIKV